MKPNTPALAIATGLIARSPAPIRHCLFPLDTAAQLYAALLGFTKCVQPNLPGLRPDSTTTILTLSVAWMPRSEIQESVPWLAFPVFRCATYGLPVADFMI
jgi:hypothetical protein